MNSVNLIGNLTRDPELRHTPSGKAVCNLSIAVQDNYNKDKAYFFNCTAWGKTGEVIEKYFVKGTKIGITGRLSQDTWEKDGKSYSAIKVIIENFDFCEKSNGSKLTKEDVSDNEDFMNEENNDEEDEYIPF